MTKDTNGPAFPQMRVWNASLAEYEDTQQYPGMTLRDWFAGQAFAGLLASGGAADWSIDADNAYRAADAMLAERNK